MACIRYILNSSFIRSNVYVLLRILLLKPSSRIRTNMLNSKVVIFGTTLLLDGRDYIKI